MQSNHGIMWKLQRSKDKRTSARDTKDIMDSYFRINRVGWHIRLISTGQFLLRWGWFILLSIAVITTCSALMPNAPSLNAYEATFQLRIHLPGNHAGPIDTNTTDTFIANLLVSPSTLSLALPPLTHYPQFSTLSVNNLQGMVTASPIAGTQLVLLNATSDSPQDASLIAHSLYNALQVRIHAEHSTIVNQLEALLLKAQQAVQNDLVNSTAELQSLQSSGRIDTSNYHLFSVLQAEEQNRLNTIDAALSTLTQPTMNADAIISLNTPTPAITTLTSTASTRTTRLALSPLVGLLMGLSGALLADRFSQRLPLRGKKRVDILPHIADVVQILPDIEQNRLAVIAQTASQSIPLLHRLRYQFNEHEKRLQFITVTSPHQREGKSTVALSLAMAAAQDGYSTILVDLHTQHPVLHEWFQQSNTIGALNIIHTLAQGVSPVNLHTPVISTSEPLLGLLTLGQAAAPAVSAQAVEPLLIDGLQPFSEFLCSQAKLIIIDAPSLLEGADAVHLTALSDLTILVVDALKSKSTTVLEAEHLLSNMSISFVTVLNRARKEGIE